jgi:hypothetical protein
MKKLSWAIALLVVAAAAPARAAVQTSGSEVLGRFQFTFNPIGQQSGFNSNSPSGYKLIGDFSGLVKPVGFGGIWLGGGLNYAAGEYGCYQYVATPAPYGNCGGDLQLWVFVRLTFEKLIPIPLVPFFHGGLGGDILFYDQPGNGGAFAIRVGGGAHYYLFKWLGLGLETNFTIGPGSLPNPVGAIFYGTWDFGLGARFTF